MDHNQADESPILRKLTGSALGLAPPLVVTISSTISSSYSYSEPESDILPEGLGCKVLTQTYCVENWLLMKDNFYKK